MASVTSRAIREITRAGVTYYYRITILYRRGTYVFTGGTVMITGLDQYKEKWQVESDNGIKLGLEAMEQALTFLVIHSGK